jgi:hypothetical protein
MANYDQDKKPYSWMPEFLRRFLNLEYDDQSAESAGPAAPAGYSSAAPAPARPGTPWAPPSEPTFKATSMETYVPPASGGFLPSPAAAPQPVSSAAGDASPAPSFALPQGQLEVISITQALRGFAHGALPPQGVEAFSKELVSTISSVGDMYGRWIGFQTGDIVKAGWGVVKAVVGLIPTGGAPATPTRRIKVMIANGNGDQEGSIKVES